MTDSEKEAMREARNAYHRDWAKRNPEKANAYHRDLAKRNPEKVNAYRRDWVKRNPEKVKAAQVRYWLKKVAELTAENN